MNKIICLTLSVTLLCTPFLFAASTTEDNFKIAKEQTLDALKELKEAKNPNVDESIYREKGSAYSEYKTSGLGPDYYKKTAESPYTKSKIAQGIAAMAASAAASIGTSMQASAAAQLQSIAADLFGSGVPEYQTLAEDLKTEAQYVKTGDSISANKMADTIKNYAATALPVDKAYKPTSSEQAALNPFAQFLDGFIASIMSVLSSQAIAVLTTALGAIFGGPLGAIASGTVGSILNSIAQSLINNTPINAAGMGSAVAGAFSAPINSAGNSISSGFKSTQTPAPGSSSGASGTATQVPGSETKVNITGSSTETQIIGNK